MDIFDALQAGDMAFVTEYVRGGGDCSVQDSIGQEREIHTWREHAHILLCVRYICTCLLPT